MKKEELSSAEDIKLLAFVLNEQDKIRKIFSHITAVTSKVILGGKTLEQAKLEEKGGDKSETNL